MTTKEQHAVGRPERFRDALLGPFLVFVAIAATIVQWPYTRIVFPQVALPLFILTSVAAVFPWTRLSSRRQLAGMTAYMVLGSLLLPLAHATTTASLFPFVAAAAAGGKLGSRKAAIGVAVAGAVVAAGTTWLVELLSPTTSQWPWWVALTVGLPVYIGMSNRDRLEALHSAQHAAEEAHRAKASEAREAALVERGRIAREIHDVLGHSLSAIALQLDMADALHDSGREDEATAAVRRARALAVDSISETRRAVQALREDTRPLPDILRQLAEHDVVDFAITGGAREVGAEATHTMVRAAQEALTNAAKYAPGARRSMRLAFTGDHVTLTVRNGPATEHQHTDLAGGTGIGLAGMRERTALLGGTLRAEPAPDGGWTVELELPR
ncbi:histidine kinase [Amycolatopsis acidiphila]|uniref:histidine kinase n=1 Tax=Amycolatopsis acidiphila TaxID=715473 RepID=A0A558ALB5_9PSEU|nr:histidine kinase [Amycolatopsis acidiphila]TVT25067.1 two-component sensor histidine kinase [Amycolatopsis acidiphila]UIJ57421.1 histidine kinase [Amycolatopsis acidiphila]GHG84328.1 two-component sensor histidine kinase [Amycolatopsis acidiphila]